MAQYPNIGAGDDFVVETLRSMIPQTVTKTATETVNNSSTYQDDDDLSGLALGVGTWWVRMCLFMTCTTSATPDIKTKWTFSGTATNAIRMIKGPGSTNVASPSVITPVYLSGVPMANDAIYGLNATSTFAYAEEEVFNLTVTVAGNLTLQWAQNTANASNTNMHAGSTVQYRQVG